MTNVLSPVPTQVSSLQDCFGSIDIYLFDQLLKGRVTPGMRVLDAGCGNGRNLTYLLRMGCDVYGIDQSADGIAAVRQLAARVQPGTPPARFLEGAVEALPFTDAAFDVVISSAVLHFARDDVQFDAMVEEMWRVLARGGLLFARLASSIGIEDRVRAVEGRRHRLPDGTERYLVDEAMLLDRTARLGGRLADPLKTTNVQGLRAMTTWSVSRP